MHPNPETPPKIHTIPSRLIGPTGSGKSGFVEAFSGSQALEIAKDQLDSVTHEVQGYRLVNCKTLGADICLVDTPGFLDKEMSEFQVFSKIAAWMAENAQDTGIHRIFYFDRITDKRMTYGRLRSLKLLQQILKVKCRSATDTTQRHVVYVTSMWNRLSGGETWARALHRFEELRACSHLWNCDQHSAVFIAKFDGSLHSASNVLSGQGLFIPIVTSFMGLLYVDWTMVYGPLRTDDQNNILDFDTTTFDLRHATNLSAYLRTILLDRISRARDRVSSLAEEVHNATGTNDELDELVQILMAQKSEVERHLLQLLDEWDEFEASIPPSTPSLVQKLKALITHWIKRTPASKRS